MNRTSLLLKDRLRHALTARDMSAVDLIARTKFSRATIYFILDGTTTPEKIRADTIGKICKALRINKDWLLHGRGDMEIAEESNDADWPGVRAYAQAAGLGNGAESDEYAEAHKLKFKASSLRRKGLHADKLAVFYGKGDSMLPRIHDGDAIIISSRPLDNE